MKFSRIAVVLSLSAIGIFAQRPASLAPARPVFHGGSGGVSRGPVNGPGHGPIGGPRVGPSPRPVGPGVSPRIVIVPLYVGGGYYYGDPYSGQGYAQQQQPLQQQDPPSVIVNQGYQPEVQNPAVYDYSNVQLPASPSLEERQSTPPPATIQQEAADDTPTIYLIAMKDGSIAAALGYWMEGDTLNYTTREGNRNRVSIDRVDRQFSEKLNADRNIAFRLPE